MKKERKVVWIKPNSTWQRCPVRLFDKYVNLLPEGGSKPNLYLQSLKKPLPYCWYSTTPIGINSLRKVVGEMLRNAGLDGFFTNHSLRRTCATRLFQAGQSDQLVKEITGHISDSVNKYKTTSDEQHMSLSEIIQGDVPVVKLSQAPPLEIVDAPKVATLEEKCALPKLVLSQESCGKGLDVSEPETALCTEGAVGDLLKSTMNVVGNRKAKLTIQVELLD